MQEVFGPVLFVVCALSIVGAVLALIRAGKTWEEYGRHRLVSDRDLPRGPVDGSTSALLERDAEIRQLLEARNERRRRRGEPEIDLERELRRLTASPVNAQLREEIRELVIARNHRRARTGKAPLDVEAEVEREIASLGELSG